MTALAPHIEEAEAVDSATGLGHAEQPPRAQIFDALADTIVDLTLAGDADELAAITRKLRAAVARWQGRTGEEWANALGQLRALQVIAMTAGDRLPSSEVVSSITPGTHAHRILQALAGRESLRASVLADELNVRADQLSRSAAQLTQELLVVRVKIGREVFWEITPRGRDVLERLGVAERVAQPAQPADSRPVRGTSTPSNVIDLFTGEPLELDRTELSREKERTTSAEERSRLLFLDLVAFRQDALTEQLKVWDRVAELAVENVKYFVPPLAVSEAPLRRCTWNLVESLRDDALPRAEWGRISPPRWDGFALIEGEDGRRLLVLLDAKSEPREFTFGGHSPRSDETRKVVRQLLIGTSKSLHAGRRWQVWPQNADAVRRLAYLLFLQQHGIEACVFNAYFVATGNPDTSPWPDTIPHSDRIWYQQIAEVRKELAIGDDHPLAGSIRSACFVAT
jgi:hypothetical protein